LNQWGGPNHQATWLVVQRGLSWVTHAPVVHTPVAHALAMETLVRQPWPAGALAAQTLVADRSLKPAQQWIKLLTSQGQGQRRGQRAGQATCPLKTQLKRAQIMDQSPQKERTFSSRLLLALHNHPSRQPSHRPSRQETRHRAISHPSRHPKKPSQDKSIKRGQGIRTAPWGQVGQRPRPRHRGKPLGQMGGQMECQMGGQMGRQER
jgi:hypothetical protein